MFFIPFREAHFSPFCQFSEPRCATRGSILALNPIVLVTDDIVNEGQRPALTRIFLMEQTNVPCFDYQFPLSLYKDGGSPTIDAHPLFASLKQEWTHLQNTLQGRYVVAFNLPLLQIQLAVTAQKYSLSTPMLVGHSLLDLLLKYARVKDPIDEILDEDDVPFSDAELCNLFAKEDVTPFFHPTSGSADQRAFHLLHALQAMANGTLSLQEPLPISALMQFTDPSLEKGLSPL